jgi:hypothetical protein
LDTLRVMPSATDRLTLTIDRYARSTGHHLRRDDRSLVTWQSLVTWVPLACLPRQAIQRHRQVRGCRYVPPLTSGWDSRAVAPAQNPINRRSMVRMAARHSWCGGKTTDMRDWYSRDLMHTSRRPARRFIPDSGSSGLRSAMFGVISCSGPGLPQCGPHDTVRTPIVGPRPDFSVVLN